MTKFLDGPAQGQTLMLKRAPRFLRVVECLGKWDALDQLDDTPGKDEKLFAYEAYGTFGFIHINAKKGGGFFSIGQYRYVQNQPTDAQMRSQPEWEVWCRANA